MPIKNYRARVGVDQSINEIQKALRKLRVREVQTAYDAEGAPSGLSFTVETDWGRRSYLLPANVDGVWAVLRRQGVPANRARAIDVGWRTLKDWVEAQVALLESGAAKLEQVMLPYMEDEGGKTVYEIANERYQPALPAGKAR